MNNSDYRNELFAELKKTWAKFYHEYEGEVNPFIFAISNRGVSSIYLSDQKNLIEVGYYEDEISFKNYFESEDFLKTFLNENSINTNVICYGSPIRNVINKKTWSKYLRFPLPIAVREIDEDTFCDKPRELCYDIYIRMQHGREIRNLFLNLKNMSWYFDFKDMNECNMEWFCPKFDGLCIEILYKIATDYLNASIFVNHEERENFFYTDYNKNFSFFIGYYHNHKNKIICKKNPLEILEPLKLQKYRIFRDQINLPSFDLSCSSLNYYDQIENNNPMSFALFSNGDVHQHDHLMFLTKIFWMAVSSDKLKTFIIEIRKLIGFIIAKIQEKDLFGIDDENLYNKLNTLNGEYLK